jgi:hypothetical protein
MIEESISEKINDGVITNIYRTKGNPKYSQHINSISLLLEPKK